MVSYVSSCLREHHCLSKPPYSSFSFHVFLSALSHAVVHPPPLPLSSMTACCWCCDDAAADVTNLSQHPWQSCTAILPTFRLDDGGISGALIPLLFFFRRARRSSFLPLQPPTGLADAPLCSAVGPPSSAAAAEAEAKAHSLSLGWFSMYGHAEGSDAVGLPTTDRKHRLRRRFKKEATENPGVVFNGQQIHALSFSSLSCWGKKRLPGVQYDGRLSLLICACWCFLGLYVHLRHIASGWWVFDLAAVKTSLQDNNHSHFRKLASTR